jgi:hypothetical protein
MLFRRLISASIGIILLLGLSCSRNIFYFASSIPEATTRYWIGPEYWANRLQDWRIHDGRIECLTGNMPVRTLHLLTRSLGETTGDLRMSVRSGPVSSESLHHRAWFGFLLGAGSPDLDYRANAIVHHASGKNGGLVAALDGTGQIVFLDNEAGLRPLTIASRTGDPVSSEYSDIELELFLRPQSDAFTLTLTAVDHQTGGILQEATTSNIPGSRLTGSLALAFNGVDDSENGSVWFRDWEVSGSKVEIHEDRLFGPILCAMHTLSEGILKLTAQLPPLAETDTQEIRLEVSETAANNWRTVATSEMIVPGWTATFRIPDWDSEADYDYRLAYPLIDKQGNTKEYFYSGTIRHDPIEQEEIVVAAFTGNSNTLGSFAEEYPFTRNRLWFPHQDLVQNVSHLRPDFLVFTGDQVYEGRPTAPDRSGEFGSFLDYLYKWYLWCWAFRDLTRDIPAVCLPDDHDVYHGNIWGAGGRRARDLPADGLYPEHYKGFESHWRQDGGGYLMPPEFVNMVQRTQTSHHPDPYDPTPVKQGISVYYGAVNYGGISFAVIEDRKFKSSPSLMVPEGKVVNGFSQVPGFDPRKADVPEAELLGERQLEFLREWTADWKNSWMKVALSQTIFANLSTYPEEFKTDAGTPRLQPLPAGEIPKGYRLAMDMDSNGWPQSARNEALHELRRGFAFMIGGDQHLGSIVHHGIEAWDDAGFSLCVPSIANLWPRRWFPPEPGLDHQEGMPPYTGRYLDGFGNHITVWAVSNPYRSGQEPAELHDRAPGFGIARLSKKSQSITMECWPRSTDTSAPDAKQYPGWPLTISLEDNYGRTATAYLPELKFSGIEYPVVQVFRENGGEHVYTIRARGSSFRPKVFSSGDFSVRIGEPGTEKMKTLRNLRPEKQGQQTSLSVEF